MTPEEISRAVEPVFTKRPDKDRYQVRFWSTSSDYAEFKNAAEREGLVLQDVFVDLMKWFVSASKAGHLQIKPAALIGVGE